MISDAHVGLTKAIRRQLPCAPKAHQGMVKAALRSVFAQESAGEIVTCWDDLAATLTWHFPQRCRTVDEVGRRPLHEAKEDVLAFRHFPKDHRRKIWSTNLLEQDEHWQLEGRRMGSAESMAAIPDLDDIHALPSASA